MKQNRGVTGGEFVRVRVKKGNEWTTISIEKELAELVMQVYSLKDTKEFKKFVAELASSVNLNFTTYSQAVKRELYNKIAERFKTLQDLIQPKLID